MNTLVNKVLSLPLFEQKPPVLVDVGASGAIHAYWKTIAPFAICLAFDADDRELHIEEKANSSFKKLLVFNSLVHPTTRGDLDFYLTKSPYCSSALEPDTAALGAWAFSDKFTVERKISLKSILLSDAMERAGIDYVDWFKTDSQGLDLNLFLSFPESVRDKILIAEFEPGIIDAYKGEDKLFKTLEYMSAQPFWLAELQLKGSQRISGEELDQLTKNPLKKKLISFSLKSAPGWGEMLYMNTLASIENERELLLAWVMATVIEQHGFAIEVARKGLTATTQPLFRELLLASQKSAGKISIRRLFPVFKQKLKSLIG
jgi:hypothetical protein